MSEVKANMRCRRPSLILVADDDRALCDALAIRLVESGFNICTARSAAEAIHLFDQHAPDAAILDIKLGQSDGFAVCQHIRGRNCTIPIILLTGASEGIIRDHLSTLSSCTGADYYLAKPFDYRILISRLRELLETSSHFAPAAEPSVR